MSPKEVDPFTDRVERNDLKSRFAKILLFFFTLFFRRKEKRITQVVISSHAFLLDPFFWMIIISFCKCNHLFPFSYLISYTFHQTNLVYKKS